MTPVKKVNRGTGLWIWTLGNHLYCPVALRPIVAVQSFLWVIPETGMTHKNWPMSFTSVMRLKTEDLTHFWALSLLCWVLCKKHKRINARSSVTVIFQHGKEAVDMFWCNLCYALAFLFHQWQFTIGGVWDDYGHYCASFYSLLTWITKYLSIHPSIF